MSALCLQSICNISTIPLGVREIECAGGLFSILRCLRSDNKNLKRLAAITLSKCSIDLNCQKTLINLNGLKILIDLINNDDQEIASYSAQILVNVTRKPEVVYELKVNGGLQEILKSLNWGNHKMIIFTLQAIVNFCKSQDAANILCQQGFLSKCTDFLKSQDENIKRLASECLSLIVIINFIMIH